MKISQFAARFGVNNDTVRYYMELNLIIPEKKGGHYHFDQTCAADMEEVLKLKEMDFTLQQIKNIFNFRRIARLTPFQRDKYYQSIYQKKLAEIDIRQAELTEARVKITEKLKEIDAEHDGKITPIGIDLTTLSLFSCPHCQQDLLLAAEKVEANQVLEGSLNCQCGLSLQIKDGILYTNFNAEKGLHVEDNFLPDYIRETDADYIDKVYQSLDWMQRQVEPEQLSGRVIMEPGSGSGIFLRQIYQQLPEDAVYICVDKNAEFNKYLKQQLELTDRRATILFITANLPELPLKEKVVDVLFDYAGTTSYSFRNKGFLPQLIDRYVNPEAVLLATYIMYQRFGPRNIVEEQFREYFKSNRIKESLLSLNYQLEREKKTEVETVEDSLGKYENFAQPGDRIYSYQVLAKRWS